MLLFSAFSDISDMHSFKTSLILKFKNVYENFPRLNYVISNMSFTKISMNFELMYDGYK